MSNVSDYANPDEQKAWNEAFARLELFLNTFDLSDRPIVSQLALQLFNEAREKYRQDPSGNPTTLLMEQAQIRLTEWLAANLEEQGRSSARVFSTGCIALLLSRMCTTTPGAFLASPLPDELKQSLHQTLLVTGPDLKISSMTPRHLDYGPMLDLARQTWHRWSFREIMVALLFWTGVYFAFYWWLSRLL